MNAMVVGSSKYDLLSLISNNKDGERQSGFLVCYNLAGWIVQNQEEFSHIFTYNSSLIKKKTQEGWSGEQV